MNLTKVNGTYSKELYENMEEIKDIVSDKSYSVASMKSCILGIIEPAWINKAAKKRFISYLNNCGSKYEIYRLCNNTVQKAMKYSSGRRPAYNV